MSEPLLDWDQRSLADPFPGHTRINVPWRGPLPDAGFGRRLSALLTAHWVRHHAIATFITADILPTGPDQIPTLTLLTAPAITRHDSATLQPGLNDLISEALNHTTP